MEFIMAGVRHREMGGQQLCGVRVTCAVAQLPRPFPMYVGQTILDAMPRPDVGQARGQEKGFLC
jgi:hypothetical protein